MEKSHGNQILTGGLVEVFFLVPLQSKIHDLMIGDSTGEISNQMTPSDLWEGCVSLEKWWLTPDFFVEFSFRFLGEMIQFDESIFQIGVETTKYLLFENPFK